MNGNADSTKSVVKEIKESCFHLLACREHSRLELLKKLMVKGYDKDEILTVIEELADKGLQSDSKYAESYARQRIQKGYGPIHIAYELRKKGVDAVNLEDIVQNATGNWMNVLEQVYTKKYGHDSVLDRNERAKRSRFLIQRGFSGTMISALFDRIKH